MTYLTFQLWAYLLIAALLGLFVGWVLWRWARDEAATADLAGAAVGATAAAPSVNHVAELEAQKSEHAAALRSLHAAHVRELEAARAERDNAVTLLENAADPAVVDRLRTSVETAKRDLGRMEQELSTCITARRAAEHERDELKARLAGEAAATAKAISSTLGAGGLATTTEAAPAAQFVSGLDAVVGGVDAASGAETIGARPQLLDSPPSGGGDDLKRISGIGLKLEQKLKDLGVFTFAQIAAWNDAEIAWVDEHLKFRGRITRDRWIEQAKTLAAGGETNFSKRVDQGGVYET